MGRLKKEVVLIDDDVSVLKALSRQIDLMGYKIDAFGDPTKGLEYLAEGHGSVLVVDLQIPKISGLEIQTKLDKIGRQLPIIFVSGHGDIPSTVRAIQGGAVDFLEKPIEYAVLERTLENAFVIANDADERLTLENELRARVERLTKRQYSVFLAIITGCQNKAIAHLLGIGERTVKAHRHEVMRRLEVTTVPELVQIAMTLDLATTEE